MRLDALDLEETGFDGVQWGARGAAGRPPDHGRLNPAVLNSWIRSPDLATGALYALYQGALIMTHLTGIA